MREPDVMDTLRGRNIRPTEIRETVLRIIKNAHFALSHADIEQLAANVPVDRVTIYRTLETLCKKGLIHRIMDESGVAKYAFCLGEKCRENNHLHDHIHFKCRSCLKIYCIKPVDMPQVHIPGKFRLEQIRISATGLCANC